MRPIDVDFDDSINVTEYNSGLGYTFTIPATPNFRGSRYVVNLPEIPYMKDPSKLPTISGMYRVEGVAPNSGEFRTVDIANSHVRIKPNMVEFNVADAGLTKTILFWSFGSLIDSTMPNTNNTITLGINKPFVDYPCDGFNDDVQLQAAIDYVYSIGGGTIKALAGSYQISQMITLKEGVNIEGEGDATIFKRNEIIADYMFYCTTENCKISNVKLDGNSLVSNHGYIIMQGSNIELNNIYVTGFIDNTSLMCFRYIKKADNITFYNMSVSKIFYGLYDSKNISNINASYISSTSNDIVNIICSAERVSNVVATNITSLSTKYNLCGIIQASYQVSNCNIASTGISVGYSLCYQLSNSYSMAKTYGYYLSENISASKASYCGDGFNSCTKISASKSDENVTGFISCSILTSNSAMGNTGYGFASCNSMGFNRSSSNGLGQYTACYAGATSTSAVSDTGNGGFNS